MGFEYQSRIQTIKTILENANTTTSTPYLSEDLSTTVQTIEVDDVERIGIRRNDLPAVYIRVRDSEEQFASHGGSGPGASDSRKFKTVNYELFGLYPKEGFSEANSSMLTNIHNFARNVEGVFQAEEKLSGTALWCNPRRTDFGDVVIKGDIVKGFRVDLEARYFFK